MPSRAKRRLAVAIVLVAAALAAIAQHLSVDKFMDANCVGQGGGECLEDYCSLHQDAPGCDECQ